jgi:hypothetical protein
VGEKTAVGVMAKLREMKNTGAKPAPREGQANVRAWNSQIVSNFDHGER